MKKKHCNNMDSWNDYLNLLKDLWLVCEGEVLLPEANAFFGAMMWKGIGHLDFIHWRMCQQVRFRTKYVESESFYWIKQVNW